MEWLITLLLVLSNFYSTIACICLIEDVVPCVPSLHKNMFKQI